MHRVDQRAKRRLQAGLAMFRRESKSPRDATIRAAYSDCLTSSGCVTQCARIAMCGGGERRKKRRTYEQCGIRNNGEENRLSPLLRVLRYENNISIRRASSFSRPFADALSTAAGVVAPREGGGGEECFLSSNKNSKGTNSRRWNLPFCDEGKRSRAGYTHARTYI